MDETELLTVLCRECTAVIAEARDPNRFKLRVRLALCVKCRAMLLLEQNIVNLWNAPGWRQRRAAGAGR